VSAAEEKAQGSGRIDYRELHLPGFDDERDAEAGR
jgi:hypothetical protein